MSKRFHEIDSLRGLAVVGMIVFHVLFALQFGRVIELGSFNGEFELLGVFVRVTFVLLVGVSMALCFRNLKDRNLFAKKQLRRGVKIFLYGFLFVTIPSIFLLPEFYVRFGILHFIGVAVLLLTCFVDRYFILSLLTVIAYPLSLLMRSYVFESEIWMALGFKVNVNTLDLFPIFPWIGLVSFGVLLGHALYLKCDVRQKVPGVLAWIGRRALVIYVVHVVLIFLLMKFI